jgi:hypothetical protein
MAEAARRPIEALAAGQVTPSEAESVLKLLEALRALLNQKGTGDDYRPIIVTVMPEQQGTHEPSHSDSPSHSQA